MKILYKLGLLVFLLALLLLGYWWINLLMQPVELVVLDSDKTIATQVLVPVRTECHPYKCYDDASFVEEYNIFEDEKADLEWKNKYILNNFSADTHIQDIAKLRGYQKRPFAYEDDLVPFRGKKTRAALRDDYLSLEKEMADQDMKIHFVSGYRSSTQQRNIFKSKLGSLSLSKISKGVYDDRINSVLKISALPAYSKHHSGYAVDFGCGTNRLVFKFAETKCYQYLSENNFENAKRFGFIPSYPENAGLIGPDPEPWEFVWVGEERLFSEYYRYQEALVNKTDPLE